MDKFNALFGISRTEIKNTCILMPMLAKNVLAALGIRNIARGKLYGAGQTDNFTLIHTGMGAPLLADAVLYLEKTPAKNLIFFGSCGLVSLLSKTGKNSFDVGSLVSPSCAYDLESFSAMLAKKNLSAYSTPHKQLYADFLKFNHGIKEVSCVTVGSLKLEEENIPLFLSKNITVIDMECSAFFSAARQADKKAIALFYVSDIPGLKPFYRKLSPEDSAAISTCIDKAVSILCAFIKSRILNLKK